MGCKGTGDCACSCVQSDGDSNREMPDGVAGMGTVSVLEEALAIVRDREGSYGHPSDHFARTTGLINVALGDTGLTPRHWALMMILDKIARDPGFAIRDTLVDIAGYADAAGRLDS